MHRTGADSNPPGSFSFRSTPKQVPKCLPFASCQARPFNRYHRRRRSEAAIQNRQHTGHRLIDQSDGFNVPLPIIEQTLELTGKIDGGNHEHVLNEKTSKVNCEEEARFATESRMTTWSRSLAVWYWPHARISFIDITSKNEECPISIFIKIDYFNVR